MEQMNAREKLDAISNWLSYHYEVFVEGIATAEDAIKLYDYFVSHNGEVNELADTWKAADLEKAIGYNPWGKDDEELEDDEEEGEEE